jgi:predicted HAD superfamily Cof-like phosphohydrolase
MQTLKSLKKHKLPINEALVLVQVFRTPGCCQGDLCRALGMGSTVISPIMIRLEGKRLICQRSPAGEHRASIRKTYHVTYPKGSALAQEFSPDRPNAVGMVREFHEKFKLHYRGKPRFLPKELSDLSIHCLYEEVEEYQDAVNAGDLEGQFDALIDLTYFALGRAYLHGFPFEEGFERVHAKNMEKRRARKPSEGKRGSLFDVVKPEGWTPPVLTDLIGGGK